MNLTKKLILFTIAGIGVYSIILLFTDLSLIAEKIKNFRSEYVPIIILLIFSSWLLLYLRWHLLLKNYNISIPQRKNFLIYFAGFALSVSPAKSGELIKSVILKEKFNVPHSHSVPIIAMERFYDVVGTLIVTVLGLWFLGIKYLPIITVVSAVLVLIFCMVYSTKIFNKFLKILGKLNFLKKFTEPLTSSQQVIKESVKGKIAVFSSLLTVIYRLIESFAIYFVLLGFGVDSLHYLKIVAIYSFSIIIGNMSFIPGGLGITEGSLAGLFSLQGLGISTAIVIAIVIRLFTLWFGVIIGFICLKLTSNLGNKPTENSN